MLLQAYPILFYKYHQMNPPSMGNEFKIPLRRGELLSGEMILLISHPEPSLFEGVRILSDTIPVIPNLFFFHFSPPHPIAPSPPRSLLCPLNLATCHGMSSLDFQNQLVPRKWYIFYTYTILMVFQLSPACRVNQVQIGFK